MAVFIWDVLQGYVDQRENLADDSFGEVRAPLREGDAGIYDNTMREYGNGETLNVVRKDIFAALHQGESLCGTVEGLSSTRADAEGERFVIACFFDDREHVFHERFVNCNLFGQLLQAGDVLSRRGPPGGRFRGVIGIAQYLFFARQIGIADPEAHEKAIELRLGQRIGSVVLGGILSGDNEEGLGERERPAVDCDLHLIHSFEQGRLGFGRGAVDFIGQQNVRKNRALFELERLGVRVVDGDAQHVTGQHIAGEL